MGMSQAPFDDGRGYLNYDNDFVAEDQIEAAMRAIFDVDPSSTQSQKTSDPPNTKKVNPNSSGPPYAMKVNPKIYGFLSKRSMG